MGSRGAVRGVREAVVEKARGPSRSTVPLWADAVWASVQPRSLHGELALSAQPGLGLSATPMVRRAGAAALVHHIKASPGVLPEPGQPRRNRQDGERGGMQ